MATYSDAFSSGGATLYLVVTTESQSVANNTSYLKCVLKIKKVKSYSSYNNGGANIYMTINGSKLYSSSTFDIRSLSVGSTKTLATKYITVSHNSDGTKSVSCKGYFASGVSLGTASISKTYTPATIPRKATISTAPNFDDEDNPKITYSNKAGSAVDSLEACIATSDGSTALVAYRDISKTGSSYTFNLTTAERDKLRAACKTSNTLSVRFYVRTYIGGTKYTSYLTKTMSIVNATPTATVSVEDSDSAMIALTGDKNKLVKYYSNAKYTISASAKKSASISSYKVTCGNKSATTSTGTLTDVESGSFSFVIKDSRGNSVTKSLTKTLINYVKPTITIKNTAKSLDGIIDINLAGNYFNSTFGTVDNTCTLQYRYKQSGGTYSDYTTVTPTFNGNTYNCNISISGLDYRNTYVIQAKLVDKINTITSKELSVTFLPVFDWGETDFNHNTNVTTRNGKAFQSYNTDGSLVNLGYVGSTDILNIGGGSYPPKEMKITATGDISLINGGYINVDSPIVLKNANSIRSMLADGSDSNILLYLSSSDNIVLGSGEKINSVYIGNTTSPSNMYLRTKHMTLRLCPPDSDSTADGYFFPVADGKVMLGTSIHRWSRVYASNSSISTSDKKKKKNINKLSNRKIKDKNNNEKEVKVYSELFDRLKPCEYKLIEDDKKINFGLVAQDVIESMKELGLDENELDLVHHEIITDDETGEKIETYGIAYENLIALLIDEVQTLKTEVKELKKNKGN